MSSCPSTPSRLLPSPLLFCPGSRPPPGFLCHVHYSTDGSLSFLSFFLPKHANGSEQILGSGSPDSCSATFFLAGTLDSVSLVGVPRPPAPPTPSAFSCSVKVLVLMTSRPFDFHSCCEIQLSWAQGIPFLSVPHIQSDRPESPLNRNIQQIAVFSFTVPDIH